MVWELAMRTKVKGTPGNQSCTVLNSNISGQAKSSMTVGTTDDEISEQLGDIFTKGLPQATFEYLRSKIIGW